MEQWKQYNIGEIVTTNIEQFSTKDDWEKALYLDTGNITENIIEEIQELPVSKLPSRAHRKVKDGDVIFSTVRPNQRHYFNPDWEETSLSEVASFVGGYSYTGEELTDCSNIAMTTIKNFGRNGGFKAK